MSFYLLEFCFICRLRGDYNGERFTYAQSLVFMQCVVNAIFAHAGMFIACISRYLSYDYLQMFVCTKE